MPSLLGLCPYCIKDVVFPVLTTRPINDSSNEFDLFCACPSCDRASIAHIVFEDAKRRGYQRDWPKVIRPEPGLSIEIIPKPPIARAPASLPEQVENLFIQGADALLGDKPKPDAAAMVFRKTLEVALKTRWPDMAGTLAHRIDLLATQHEITRSLADWAHAIRLDGNAAVHDTEPVTTESATSLRDFTELFLMYVFTLPAMLEERRRVT
ncbi:DUF4145 domain-containing protein [Thauera humireducens]|uniref:DUF4145 domain-containing protein n=1 Tax=Thauera humireducens TaxID=1134435 RepID=A0A127K398_9RHOO|nr:DUF4145 domain-containing protein [Thauera humireducens]AMO36433.1 hypothetical protein AC731_005480 [Thauera humireducens]